MIGHQPLDLLAGILAALVRMMQQGFGLAPAPDRHHQRVGNELRRHRRTHRPAHDAAREQVDHGSHIQPVLGGPDVGKVGDPLLVWRLGAELAIKDVGRNHRSLAIILGQTAPARPCPGKAPPGSAPWSLTHLRKTLMWRSRSRAACGIVTPRTLTSFAASSLNSRLNLRRCIHAFRFHKTLHLGVHETGSSSSRCITCMSSLTVLSPVHSAAAQPHSLAASTLSILSSMKKMASGSICTAASTAR